MDRPSARPAVFATLAELVSAESSYAEVYAAICSAAVEGIEPCDHASLLVRHHGRYEIAAASDDVAERIDSLERTLGEGPCVDAIEQSSAQWTSDLSESSPWPTLGRHVRTETPVRAMAGLWVALDGNERAALNIYSDNAVPITAEMLDRGAVLAAFASVVLIAAGRGREAATLREGLASNREIGKATGLLMAMHHVTDEQAFDMLAKISQDMNQKLARVAVRVVEQHHRGVEGAALTD